MKRIIPLTLALALCLSLAACGGGSNSSGSSSGSGSSSSGSSSSSGAVSYGADGSQSEPDKSDPDASGSDGSQAAGSQSEPDASQPEQQPEQKPEEAKPILTLNSKGFTLFTAGSTFRLRYTCEPDISGAKAEFTSSNEKVATVAADGTVTAVAPGVITITLKYGGLTATCPVACKWTEQKPAAPAPQPQPEPAPQPQPEPAPQPQPEPEPAPKPEKPASVDLSAFCSGVFAKYEFPAMEMCDSSIIEGHYPGLTAISTAQCIHYAPMMTGVAAELTVVQVNNAADAAAVKSILQARVNAQVDGGAWYPETIENWKNNSRIVSNGSYVLLIVSASCDSIVGDFSALF